MLSLTEGQVETGGVKGLLRDSEDSKRRGEEDQANGLPTNLRLPYFWAKVLSQSAPSSADLAR
jgi:hypothetical protein